MLLWEALYFFDAMALLLGYLARALDRGQGLRVGGEKITIPYFMSFFVVFLDLFIAFFSLIGVVIFRRALCVYGFVRRVALYDDGGGLFFGFGGIMAYFYRISTNVCAQGHRNRVGEGFLGAGERM